MSEDARQISRYTEGVSLPGGPRFSLPGHQIICGPYDSPASHDRHLSETYESGDPFLDSTDDIRFSPANARLVSLRLFVPKRPGVSDAFADQVHALTGSRGFAPTGKGPTLANCCCKPNLHRRPWSRVADLSAQRRTTSRANSNRS